MIAGHLAAFLLTCMKTVSTPTAGTRGKVPTNLFFAQVHFTGVLSGFRDCLEELDKIVDGKAGPSAATSSQEL
jgi:hypothetical protein